MSMTLVLANQIPHPLFGWLGIKRRTTPIVETLDDYDALLFAFADSAKPTLSMLANAYQDQGDLSPGQIRALLGELREVHAHLRNEGTAAWPRNAPGPKVQPTIANIERIIATCERVSALLELAIERQATIWFDSD